MSHPTSGPDGPTPPDGVAQPPNPPAGEQGDPLPSGSAFQPAPPAGSPYPAPQQPTGPHGGASTYASGSAAVPVAGYPQGGGYQAEANPTLAMPAVADPGGYPAPAGYDQHAYPSAEGYGPGAHQAGYPGQAGPASAPGVPRKGRTVLVLALVAALLFVVGGVMSGLFVAKSSELNRTERELRAQVSDRDTKIDAHTKEIDRLKRELEVANDKIGAVQQDLTGTKNDRDELERQKQVISNCFDLLGKAATATTRSAYEKAMKEADKVCDEAENYL